MLPILTALRLSTGKPDEAESGAPPRLHRQWLRGVRRLAASLTLKMIALITIFVALPVLLYGQFESADRKERDLVISALQRQSWLIAQALAPLLDSPAQRLQTSLGDELRKYTDDGSTLRLMFRPGDASADKQFYYVASAPRVGAEQLSAELDSLAERGILSRLSETCSWDAPVEFRYRQPNGREQILTSVIPIQSRWGCWVLISAHATSEFLKTSIGLPFWQTPEIRMAAFIYVIGALLAVVIALSVWRSVRQFGNVAREIRQGRTVAHSFSARNLVPEFTGVADDFDQLVLDLRSIARDIRQTAEDNAHSFKTPLATVQSSVETLRRGISGRDQWMQRTLYLIDKSVDRLRALVNAAQRLDNNTADLIEAPRTEVDLTQVLADLLLGYRELLAERGIRLARRLDEAVVVRAAKETLAVVAENILDNAISFAPPNSTIRVTLGKAEGIAYLDFEDEGPGIDPRKLDHIFERYFSLRQEQPSNGDADSGDHAASDHAGLGLWIVKRNVESLGGRATATNRIGGGFSVRVVLPTVGG
jgi:two-component system, OmpR family, sensor histidine kinase ChvG